MAEAPPLNPDGISLTVFLNIFSKYAFMYFSVALNKISPAEVKPPKSIIASGFVIATRSASFIPKILVVKS